MTAGGPARSGVRAGPGGGHGGNRGRPSEWGVGRTCPLRRAPPDSAPPLQPLLPPGSAGTKSSLKRISKGPEATSAGVPSAAGDGARRWGGGVREADEGDANGSPEWPWAPRRDSARPGAGACGSHSGWLSAEVLREGCGPGPCPRQPASVAGLGLAPEAPEHSGTLTWPSARSGHLHMLSVGATAGVAVTPGAY